WPATKTYSRSGTSADGPDPVTLDHPRHHVVAVGDPSEDGVPPVQVRLRREVDEPLRTPGVGARERHPDHHAVVSEAVDLVANRPPRPALPGSGGIAILDHEVGHHPVPA